VTNGLGRLFDQPFWLSWFQFTAANRNTLIGLNAEFHFALAAQDLDAGGFSASGLDLDRFAFLA